MKTYLIEDRRAEVSAYGKGNSKLGSGIYTYSKLPGNMYSCPGSSPECEAICYAKKLIKNHMVWELLKRNSERSWIENPPLDAKIVRWHVSGDFDTWGYVNQWCQIVESYKHIKFFGYTRSWRIASLCEKLEELRTFKNVSLFASMDSSIQEMPPVSWQRAWIEGDQRIKQITNKRFLTFDNRNAIVCPEETAMLPNCESCEFCFKPRKMDLVFLKH